MKKTFGRLLAVVTALCLLVCLLPTMAFSVAAESELTLTYTGTYARQSDRYLLILDGLTDTSDRYWNNNTIYVNGEEVTGDGVHYVPNAVGSATDTKLLMLIYPAAFGKQTMDEVTGEYIVQIQAGTTLGGYTVANDLVWKLNGSSVTSYTPTTLVPYDAQAQDGNARFYIRLTDKNGLQYDASDIYWNNNTILVDGNPVSGDSVHWWHGHCGEAESKITLFASYGGVEAGVTAASSFGEHTLTVPYGTVLGGKYMVINEVNYAINGSTISYVAPPLPQVDVTLSNDDTRNASSGANGFYFYVDPADPLASDVTNWSARYAIKSGSVTLNDTPLTGARTLAKLTSNLYYCSLIDNGTTASAGDVVTIDCSIDDGSTQVNLQKQHFQFNGTGWSLYVPKTTTEITGLAGHVAAQGEPNSRFIVGLNLTENPTTEPSASPAMTVLVNGEEKTVNTAWLAVGGYYYKHLLLPYTSYPADSEYTVVVPAGTDFDGLKTTADFTFYIHKDNSINTTPPAVITINGLGATVGTQPERYLIALDTDVEFSGVAANPTRTITVNGNAYEPGIAWLDDGNGVYEWTLLIYRSDYPLGTEYTVTVPAGTDIRGYELTNEFTFYIHADGGIDTTPPAEPKEAVVLEGATIKTDTDLSKQGMRYEIAVVDADALATAQEFGVLLLPKAMLGSNELTVDTDSVLKIATKNGDAYWSDILAEGGFQAALTNAVINGRQNLKIVSRVYAVMADGSVVYDEADVKSVASVALAIANTAVSNGATASAEVSALLANDALTDDEIALILTFCRENIDKL